MSIRTAIVLAAGEGTKIWPYNVVRQKATFPIANVPAIRRTIDALAALDVTRFIVVIGYGEASVRAALRGVDAGVVYVRQSQLDGTALATCLAAQGLEEDFLVVYGDLVTHRQNLSSLMDHFTQERPMATALIQPLDLERPQDWLVAFAEEGHLRGIEGHSRDGRYRLCGIYAFQPQALGYLNDNPGLVTQVPVGGMPPLEAEIAQSLQMMIDEGETVTVVETSGYFVDLDKPWHILEANHYVIDGLSMELEQSVISPSAHIHDGAEIQGRVVLGENAVIGNRVVVKGDLWLGDGASVTNGAILDGATVIGADTKVRDYAYIGGHSSLGARGVYGHGAEFGGVALDTVYCYHYCEIWGVVGQAVDFGAATVCGNLRFDDGETVWKIKGRPQVPTHASNAAYFGDFCRTGVNAILMPGRRIGVYACVGAGVVVYDDVPDRQMVLLNQNTVTHPWGPERYGW
ncbi:MAG: NTP transferase domain-containing protein [Anaerolineae bacterium]|nr:NTP transferase domain-containing protein [Anaerolineae bacterium]